MYSLSITTQFNNNLIFYFNTFSQAVEAAVLWSSCNHTILSESGAIMLDHVVIEADK